MQITARKVYAMLLLTMLLVSGVSLGATAFHTVEKTVCDTQSTNSEDTTTEQVTLYRFGPDGIQSVPTEIIVKPDETRDQAIAEKCAELALNDEQLVEFFEQSGLNLSLISFVQSRGRGLHFDLKIRIPWKKLYELYPNVPPHYRVLKFPIVFARYPFHKNAKTLINSGINRSSINGTHSVLCLGFYGYTGWLGMVSLRGFLSPVNGFAGFSLVTKTTEL